MWRSSDKAGRRELRSLVFDGALFINPPPHRAPILRSCAMARLGGHQPWVAWPRCRDIRLRARGLWNGRYRDALASKFQQIHWLAKGGARITVGNRSMLP